MRSSLPGDPEPPCTHREVHRAVEDEVMPYRLRLLVHLDERWTLIGVDCTGGAA